MDTTVSLSFEAIDDLIYSARIGDLDALKTDITNLCKEHNCSALSILNAAIDAEDESEGGTGACLLHWPAANGNVEILTFLLEQLQPQPSPSTSQDQQQQQSQQPLPNTPLLNHPNNSGNTPLHWAALNTHLPCVKALVNAGADLSAKNHAGHDAVFLAERTGWSAEADDAEEQANANVDDEGGDLNGGEEKVKGKGREVVEWLLGCKAGAGLETGAGGAGAGAGSGNGEESAEADIREEDEMEGVEAETKGKK